MDRLINLLEGCSQFFNDHDLAQFPESLLERIGDLEDYKLIKNSMEDINATYREVVERLSGSNSLMGISPMFNSRFPEIAVSIARRNSPISLILTQDIYKKVTDKYEDTLRAYLACESARLYIIDEARLALAVTDTFVSISLYHKKGGFDAQTNLMSFDKSALKWGEELFEHYRRKSKQIKSLY
jgi:predicted transcriptional regulator